MAKRSVQALSDFLQTKPVVTLEEMQAALGDASRPTVFRYLKDIPYRRSYDHNGRYYTRHDPAQYDRLGLFRHGGIHFSRDGSLGATVRRMVQEAEAGHTHRELQELLRVRVQSFLLKAVREGALDREKLAEVYVYLHVDEALQREQLERRRERIAKEAEAGTELDVSDEAIIQVLLTLIRRPGSTIADVVRHLQGHSPPIKRVHVAAVFDRYDLGEKGGSSIS
jgi:hypothetical protein